MDEGLLKCSQCEKPVAVDTNSIGSGRESELLDEAIRLPDGDRQAFLDQACSDDAALRSRLQIMLDIWCPECRKTSEVPPEQLAGVGFLTCTQCGRPVAFDTHGVGPGGESALFLEALRLGESEREAFLHEACAEDVKLRCRLHSRLHTWCPECEAESKSKEISCGATLAVLMLAPLLAALTIGCVIGNPHILVLLSGLAAAWLVWRVHKWSTTTRVTLILVIGVLVALSIFMLVQRMAPGGV